MDTNGEMELSLVFTVYQLETQRDSTADKKASWKNSHNFREIIQHKATTRDWLWSFQV